MKKLVAALLLLVGLTGIPLVIGGSMFTSDRPYEVLWQGETNEEMLAQVRHDIAVAQNSGRNLKVHLMSPGGSVVLCLEMARIIRNASDAGTTIEIHGEGLVASCGTFILSAGTPGYRYITKTAVFLVHPPQRMSMFEGASCIVRPTKFETQEEKILGTLFMVMEDTYVRNTGHKYSEVKDWLTCGNETVGAENAVLMGMADRLER